MSKVSNLKVLASSVPKPKPTLGRRCKVLPNVSVVSVVFTELTVIEDSLLFALRPFIASGNGLVVLAGGLGVSNAGCGAKTRPKSVHIFSKDGRLTC